MVEPKIYDAKNVVLTVNGRVIQGFNNGDMISYTRKNDIITTDVDAQGAVQLAVNNSQLATMTINMSGNSADYGYLLRLANKKEFLKITVKSDIETITVSSGIFTKTPDAAYGTNVPSRSFTVECLESYITDND